MEQRIVDLDDATKFVGWYELPQRHMGDSQNGFTPYLPQHHWCLLGEIVSRTAYSHTDKHTLTVRDKNGNVSHTQLDAYKRVPSSRCYKAGYTVAILYPERFDEKVGLTDHDRHYAESTQMEVFPFTLEEILKAVRKTRVHAIGGTELANACQVCRVPSKALTRCGWCKLVWYCTKGPCRSIDRSHGHRETCHVLRKMREFLTRDWDNFRGFWKANVGSELDTGEVPECSDLTVETHTPNVNVTATFLSLENASLIEDGSSSPLSSLNEGEDESPPSDLM